MASLREQFQQSYGRPATLATRAPGRVEFIGNHTDYNGGAVIGAAIDRGVEVAIAAAPAGRFRVRSTSGAPALEFTGAPVLPLAGAQAWGNYIFGTWQALKDFSQARPEGFDLLVGSDLPAGAGLSSSAALELATALALLGVAKSPPLSAELLAQIGRHAENKYVGVPCGILDQGTSAFGAAGQLVHIDCRGPIFKRVPFPASAHLWTFNTREKHALVDGLYAARHRECTEAARELGVPFLTDLTPAQLAAQAGRLAPVVAKRAQHIVEEHARVHATVAALERGDLAAVGKLLTASHRSSQHLFENSTPALDRLVDALERHPAVYGARLTGGGFGGAVMALTRDTFAAADASAIAAVLEHPAETLHLQSADGARVTWRA